MHASGDATMAAQAIREAEAMTARSPGVLTWSNGRQARFTHLADSDELTGSTVPCFVGEHVVDFAYDELRSITLDPGGASFDWLWMPADIEFAKKEAPLFGRIPALYSGAGIHPSKPVRTGQMTSWNRDHGYAIGEGQRDLYVHTEQGMMIVGLRQVKRIAFDAKGSASAQDEKPKSFWQKLFG
jgi:protein involved in temperature-dependent protein secretion